MAREAFARGLTGENAFPELWFELPLAGEPWFDLHMLWRRGDAAKGASFAGLTGAYADALAWFSAAANVRQLALSFDTGAGDSVNPAVQLLVDNYGIATMEGFLESCGRGDLSPACRAFISRMPRSWYACYVGVFPQRSDGGAQVPWLRLECLADGERQRAYSQDALTLTAGLEQVGFSAFDETLAGTVFARRVRARDEEAHLSCYPAFIKLRWREGHAPDAKAYLIAGCTRRTGTAREEDWRASDRREA